MQDSQLRTEHTLPCWQYMAIFFSLHAKTGSNRHWVYSRRRYTWPWADGWCSGVHRIKMLLSSLTKKGLACMPLFICNPISNAMFVLQFLTLQRWSFGVWAAPFNLASLLSSSSFQLVRPCLTQASSHHNICLCLWMRTVRMRVRRDKLSLTCLLFLWPPPSCH